jgi:hypothetical protein
VNLNIFYGNLNSLPLTSKREIESLLLAIARRHGRVMIIACIPIVTFMLNI